jgi:hypothetical protein
LSGGRRRGGGAGQQAEISNLLRFSFPGRVTSFTSIVVRLVMPTKSFAEKAFPSPRRPMRAAI